jgi:adenosylcobinamide-phosphate synthase
MSPAVSDLWALPLGVALDAALGDPERWPHPVRVIGWLISKLEHGLRAVLEAVPGRAGPLVGYAGGVALAAVVVGVVGGLAWLSILAGELVGPAAVILVKGLLIYWGLAARGLGEEARKVADETDLGIARRRLSMIVGRDTEGLDRAEVCRACVETVAENGTDAVVAPLFWFTVGGVVGLWVYKAVNTLDSMVGYRDERYARLGWASARLDDVLGFVPARLTWVLYAVSALITGGRPLSALRIGWRDGRKHPSPNAAWGEAAMAGALGVRLGGPASYRGVPGFKPYLGEPEADIGPETVRLAVRLMRVSSGLAAALAWLSRAWFAGFLDAPARGLIRWPWLAQAWHAGS